EPAHEVGGAVQRVDSPPGPRPGPTRLLGEHRHPGRFRGQHLEDRRLAAQVPLRDVVAGRLGLARTGAESRFAKDPGAGARRGKRYLKRGYVSRPRPNIASRSWEENCW